MINTRLVKWIFRLEGDQEDGIAMIVVHNHKSNGGGGGGAWCEWGAHGVNGGPGPQVPPTHSYATDLSYLK